MSDGNKSTKLLIGGVAIVGVIALILLITGVATKDWVTVVGNTDELRRQVNAAAADPDPAFQLGLYLAVTAFNTSQATLLIDQYVITPILNQLGGSVSKTAYDLFEKKTNTTTKVSKFKTPQGLIIAGLVCLFIGLVLALLIGYLPLQRVIRVIRVIPLLFLVTGPILITVGYIYYTKLMIEDFGGGLGTTVTVGYSFVLVIVASIIGYITAVFFAFTILHHRHDSQKVTVRST